MKTTELKSYLGVLKSIAKSGRLDTLKGIKIESGDLSATNLDIYATLTYSAKGEGVYNSKVLDLIALSAESDLTAYQFAELRDFPDFMDETPDHTIDLNTRHSRGTLGEILIHALDFVSTDQMRPALTGVWLKGGEVVATDGYRAIASSKLGEIPENLEIGLPAPFLKLYKKVAKFGEWSLSITTNTLILTNGNLTIISKQLAGTFPEARTLVNENRTYTYKAVIPYKQLKPLFSKSDQCLTIGEGGELILDGRPLPLSAELAEQEYEFDLDCYRTLLCGRVDEGATLDPNLLATYKTDKAGNITIRYNLGKLNKVYSVVEPIA